MLDPKKLDELGAKMSAFLAATPAKDIEKNTKAVFSGLLAKLDLVTREEFDIQAQVLARTREKLKEIFAHWEESETAEALVRDIIDQTPDSLVVRIVAYRFYFYRRRCREAAHWALACLEWLSDQLHLPRDWRQVTPDMADFRHRHRRLGRNARHIAKPIAIQHHIAHHQHAGLGDVLFELFGIGIEYHFSFHQFN